MKQMSRYHPLLVTLHWLTAVLIVAALFVGFFVLATMPNADPRKINILLVHMAGGMLILALMVIRLIVRMLTSKPTAATTGSPLLDRIAPVVHYGFYLLVLLMVASGYATAILAGLSRSVFAHSGEPLPESFAIYPSFVRTARSRRCLRLSSPCTCWPCFFISLSAKTICSGGCCSAGAALIQSWHRNSCGLLQYP